MPDLKDFQKLAWYIQFLIVGGVMGGLLGLFWYQFLSPMGEQIVQLDGQLQTLQQEIAKIRQQKVQLEKFKAESEALQVRLDSLKSILPLERETPLIMQEVQAAAENSALRIMRLAPRAIVDKEVYTEWPIDMEIVGSYHNLGLFLDRIRTLSRIMNINNLRLSMRQGDADAQAASVLAMFSATTFVYKEEPAAK